MNDFIDFKAHDVDGHRFYTVWKDGVMYVNGSATQILIGDKQRHFQCVSEANTTQFKVPTLSTQPQTWLTIVGFILFIQSREGFKEGPIRDVVAPQMINTLMKESYSRHVKSKELVEAEVKSRIEYAFKFGREGSDIMTQDQVVQNLTGTFMASVYT